MNRKTWLTWVFIFLIVVLALFWFWFLRYNCDDSWCLLLESRKADIAAEQVRLTNTNLPILSNQNINTSVIPANSNTATETNANHNTNTAPVVNTNTATTQKNIQVTSPTAGTRAVSPLTVTGKAREFENIFNYRLTDDTGTVIAQNRVVYTSSDTGQFGDFSFAIPFTPPTTTKGTLTLFAKSPRDGSEIDTVSIPLTF